MSNRQLKFSYIKVASRQSPLARAQVEEVEKELKNHHPHVRFLPTFLETTGDLDQKTSLRTLHKSNFFTRELDALVLEGKCDLAIHSAKDLPDPLPEGLCLIALTQGLDPSDALVFRPGETLSSLPPGARIATSSLRREEMVRCLREDLNFIDLRGPIHERLSLLERREADGVVVATAALIRLGLMTLNFMKIPGSTTPMQGQLAIISRENSDFQTMFAALDSR